MNFGDNNGYSSWEGPDMYRDSEWYEEKVSSFPYDFESPYDGHNWLNEIIDRKPEWDQDIQKLEEEYQEALENGEDEYAEDLEYNIECYKRTVNSDTILGYAGVFRSDISHNLDLFIIGRGLEEYRFLYKKDCDRYYDEFEMDYQGMRGWEVYHQDTLDDTTRKLETHKYMVCGFALEDNKLSFIVSAPGGLISIAPTELRLLVIFNAVGGLCIHDGLIGLTGGMRRLHRYQGKGIGKFTRTEQTLYLPLHQYSKSGKKWYMSKWFAKDDDFLSIIGSVAVAADLVSAGFLVEDDNGNKLSKAALSRVALGIK